MTLVSAAPLTDVCSFGPFQLFASARRLEKDGVAVDIGSRAFDILAALVEQRGKVIGNRELIARVWRDVIVEESSLRVNIAGLRRALGDTGGNYIANIPGQGYCFVAPLSGKAATPASASPAFAYPLPGKLARMVGRAETVEALSQQLRTQRFINIVGPGGIGKTTTAVAVAHKLLDEFKGAVCFIDLVPLASGELLVSTIAATLGLMSGAATLQGLTALLQDQQLLLVLDNCEHLIEPVAELTERLFQGAPRLFILATSREPLRVEGEHTHRLAPLDSPPASDTLSAAQALTFPAVQLFVERAAAGGDHFAFVDADAAAVAEICRKLDGIALAIELGASRVSAYGVRGTAQLLDNRFRLSWQGRRTAMPRHQTLKAMLDWSYNLLPEFERMVLRRLSTFIGDFSLEAAGEVAADDQTDAMHVIEAVGGLVAKSLASTASGAAVMRYRLLDSVRVYAIDKLRESGEAAQVARRHALYLCGVFDQLAAQSPRAALSDADAGAAAEQVERLGNLRAALEWCFSADGDAALGVRLATASTPLLLRLSMLTECARWSEQALALLSPADLDGRREMALQETLAISLMFANGNSDTVLAAIERGLALARQQGDLAQELRLLAGLNIFRTRVGNFAAALAVAKSSVGVAEAIGDTAAIAMAEWMLGVSYHLVGDQAAAQQHCEAGLAMVAGARHVNTMFFGYDHRIRALVALARALWVRGRPEQAAVVAWQAINDADQGGDPISVCIALIYAAPVFTWNGEWDVAAALLDRLIAHAKKHGIGPYHAVGIGLKGELLVRRGQPQAGVALLHECLDVLRAGHHQVLNTVFVAALAAGLAAGGCHDEAQAAIAEAAEVGAASFDSPEILRIQGELLASMPQPDLANAEQYLQWAIDAARANGALAWELRAAVTLARVQWRQGRRGDARELLTAVLARFSEGYDSVDQLDARQLLDYIGA